MTAISIGESQAKLSLFGSALLAICLVASLAYSADKKPIEAVLTLVVVADSVKTDGPEYVFVVNGAVAYRTVDGLKKYIQRLPKGSTLTWEPGCMRFGGEPLLSSAEEMESFKVFCESCGITFVLVPSG
jgi:hypothetical protein